MHRHLICILLFGTLLAACGDDDTPAAEPAPEATPTASAPRATDVPAPTPTPTVAIDTGAPDPTPSVTSPQSAIEDHLAWFVARLADPTTLQRDDIETRFSTAFLAQVPVEALIASTPQIVAGTEGPYVVQDLQFDEASGSATAVVRPTTGGDLDLVIAVEPNAPWRIIGLAVTPALTEPTSAEDLDATLASLVPVYGVTVFDVTAGDCSVLQQWGTDDAMPVGSAFKLWVLAELAHQIEQGTARWDEPLAITAEHRSSPDGEAFALADGETLTLREHAELMIAISDNTATDHLMARLGRENVEAAMARIGIESVEANTPLLDTGAFFQLKFIADAPNAQDWRSLDTEGRRALLEEIDASVRPWVERPITEFLTNADGVGIDQPRDFDIEWFATPEGLCRTMVHLGELAERPGLEAVADILEINAGSGIGFDRAQWPTIRFKGGSEPGVVAGAWWFAGVDGRRLVLVGAANDPEAPLDEVAVVTALASAITLVEAP